MHTPLPHLLRQHVLVVLKQVLQDLQLLRAELAGVHGAKEVVGKRVAVAQQLQRHTHAAAAYTCQGTLADP